MSRAPRSASRSCTAIRARAASSFDSRTAAGRSRSRWNIRSGDGVVRGLAGAQNHSSGPLMSELKLGALVTHPVQYQSPLFRELAKRCDLTVYYAHRPTAEEQGAGFGLAFQWDIDLTSGYEHVWLENVAERPNVTNYSGCDTPEISGIIA